MWLIRIDIHGWDWGNAKYFPQWIILYLGSFINIFLLLLLFFFDSAYWRPSKNLVFKSCQNYALTVAGELFLCNLIFTYSTCTLPLIKIMKLLLPPPLRDACLDLTKLSLQGKWMMASQSHTCRGNFTFWLSLVFVDSC